MTYRAPHETRRCTAHNRTGSRCYVHAIEGGTVCRYHGGAAPQVQAKAEDRMRALVHPAITALEDLIEGRDLGAVKYTLDWAGFKAIDKLESDGKLVIEVEYVPTVVELPPPA